MVFVIKLHKYYNKEYITDSLWVYIKIKHNVIFVLSVIRSMNSMDFRLELRLREIRMKSCIGQGHICDINTGGIGEKMGWKTGLFSTLLGPTSQFYFLYRDINKVQKSFIYFTVI